MSAVLVDLVISVWALGLAVIDLRWRRLPNVWLLSGFAFGLGSFVVTGGMPLGAGLLEAALAMGMALACFVPFYLARWMGAGDVKFLAVIGWLGGFEVLFGALLFGSLLAGAMALVLKFLPFWGLRHFSSARLAPYLQARVPYGACLAIALLYSVWAGYDYLPAI